MKAFRHTCRLLLCVGLMSAAAGAAPSGKARPLTPAQRTELQTLKAQLADPERTARTKRDAAVLLLTRPYPQAVDALGEFLQDKTNRAARIAIAEAVAQTGLTRPEFIPPLVAMLTGPDAAARGPAAQALSAYKDGGVLEEFTQLVTDPKTDRSIRLVIISAMQRILDKRAVDALVRLLGDRDEDVRNAACDALGKLTNIRAFGRDPRRWKSWWAKNKGKPQSEWLIDLADSLARANLELESANAALRRRLGAAMNDLYAATPPAGRDGLLVELLKDDVAEVRLAGARLLGGRLTSTQPVSEPLRAQALARVTDPVPAVRREVALLVPALAGADAAKVLTDRLQAEQATEVREALYRALGLLRDPAVWDRLVAAVRTEDRRVAAAAAGALARVAERNGADDERRAPAVEALKKRYRPARNDPPDLREALLTAMGALKAKSLAPLLTAALKDPAATVRLSAIKGLQKLGNEAHASEIAALASDSDRGVRLAAISAVGALGGTEHLETLLARTEPRVEPDAAVRQQAWAMAMGLLEKTDPGKLKLLADRLARRPDAREHLIGLLKLWLGKIPPRKVSEWTPVRLRLGEVLLAAGRPAEAAGELRTVHAALVKAGGDRAGEVWLQWVRALLAADDASAVARIAGSKDADRFAAAVEQLNARLAALKDEKSWDAFVRLAAAAEAQLADRLDPPAREKLAAHLAEARTQQRLEDRQRVSTLVRRLTAADEAERKAAAAELAAMKARAVVPLAEELRKVLAAEAPDPKAEAAILEQLRTLAPDLSGYDADAPRDRRLATVEQWIRSLGS